MGTDCVMSVTHSSPGATEDSPSRGAAQCSFVNPTPLAHADALRDVLPRGGTSQSSRSRDSVASVESWVLVLVPIRNASAL
ncbi:hypothetical protein TNCV_1872841 [Trichonephila clavipes]|nr:hypothetical protein TNCV_1872841 [Trichonephila clavipes]